MRFLKIRRLFARTWLLIHAPGTPVPEWVIDAVNGWPSRQATPDEAFELGRTTGWDEGFAEGVRRAQARQMSDSGIQP